VSGGYYRNWYRNLSSLYTGSLVGVITSLYVPNVHNLLVTPSDFSPYCVTAPPDPRLPNGGGYQICGLYDINPNKFGQFQNVVEQTSHYGNAQRYSDFINLTFDARLKSGLRFGGGLDTGRSVNDFCFVVDSPQQLLNCRIATPFKAQTELKLHAIYPLPGEFVVAGLLQSTPGPAIDANYAVSNNQIAPSLGRNLSACGAVANCTASVTIPLYSPQNYFEPRRTQLDLRLSRMIKLGARSRLQANLDAYNVLNAGPVLAVNTTYGPNWQHPTQILDARLFQFSGQLTF
jgi:hypothetical protein